MKLRIPSLLIIILRVARASPFYYVEKKHKTGHPGAEPWSEEFWYHVIVSIFLVLLGGVFAGLTLGLMGLDELHLRVLATSSEDRKQKQNAQRVLKLLDKGKHWVLVIVNESLPIFLDSAIGGGYAAIVISTAAIGEPMIIPQAVSVRYGLSIGAACVPLVLATMYILAPIAWPIAKLLDKVLGTNEEHTYKKAELKSFLQFHRTGAEPLRDDEIAILNGVLELNSKRIEDIMTPIKARYGCPQCRCYPGLRGGLFYSGYSRFPVHEAGNKDAFIGTLLVKTLLTYDPKLALPVSSFPLSVLPEASPSINCFQALDYFQTGRAHLLLISRTPGRPGGALGVITLEEIVDETDQFEDNHSKKRVRRHFSNSIHAGIVERERTALDNRNTETSSLLYRPRGSSVDAPLVRYGSI
ncbi:hypothetical protein CVT26_014012 [Gymnopilus dilepis]|uniref:CNNM transmembrane domain-containing protein n=1 Tax=Gymnopilus dilepis TaxID=231916 RepID=A0A409Y8P8_9AGAR|nr:hypothetical protein CVT26_014012 [Gymnopilus dilepis]